MINVDIDQAQKATDPPVDFILPSAHASSFTSLTFLVRVHTFAAISLFVDQEARFSDTTCISFHFPRALSSTRCQFILRPA